MPLPLDPSLPRARSAARRSAVVLALATSLSIGAGMMTTAQALSPDLPRSVPTPQRGHGLIPSTPGQSLVTDETRTPVAPGLNLTRFDRFGSEGWVRGQVLVADLAENRLRVDHISSGTVTGKSKVTEQAARTGAIAAINGDYFDMNDTDAPIGTAVSRRGGLVNSATEGRAQSVAIGADGLGRLAQVFLEGEVTVPETGRLKLSGVNSPQLTRDGIGLFTDAWGPAPRTKPVAGAERVTEVRLRGGKVTEVRPSVGSDPVPAGASVLLGREAGAGTLARLRVGDAVSVAYRPRADFGKVAVAVGGGQVLVDNGTVRRFTEGDTVTATSRTAVGFSADGRTMYLVAIDGKQTDSRGMDLNELGDLMKGLGAANALNMDGGGSTTMAARLPGEAATGLISSPSDGSERQVANGLGLFAAPGSGTVRGFRVGPALTADGSDRLFPHLHRTVRALAHDETYAPLPVGRLRWKGSGKVSVRPSGGGTALVTGVRSGVTRVEVSGDRGASGETALTVLAPAVRIAPSSSVIALDGVRDTAQLTITGYDALGDHAPIDASDVKVTGGDGVVSLQPSSDATFTLRGLKDAASTTLRLTVGRMTTRVAVTVGLTENSVADLTDAASWTSANDRAPDGSVAPAAGHDGTSGLRLSYDFTKSTATRGQYAVPPQAIPLPGQPQAVTMWINGDGNGAWPRLQYRTAAGVTANLDGPMITWTGWRKVEFPVPVGTPYPLTLQRVRLLETSAARSYTGEVTISDLRVKVAPDVELPSGPKITDPVVVTDGTVDGRPLRVAVMSDAQFVARDPNSPLVEAARRTLAEIARAKPDVLVIDGDLVDEGSPADFALARTLLNEFDSLTGGKVPWHYVPGNHEAMGPGSTVNFKAAFGDTTSVFDARHTRFITLDTSSGTLRGGGFAQLQFLHDQLEAAGRDRSVSGVVVFEHHPTQDPLPDKASQLGDRKEAELVEKWLADFRVDAHKSAAFVSGHVGAFAATTVDGVPYLVNGNSGKNPASTPDNGGFTGWTMLGIDPRKGRVDDRFDLPARDSQRWLQAEMHARTDSVNLTAPDRIAVGVRGHAAATLTQDGTRTVPVAWPVGADWSGIRTEIKGAAAEAVARRGTAPVISYDPVTGLITALRPGTAVLRVTVNGVTAQRTVTVPRTSRSDHAGLACPGPAPRGVVVTRQRSAPTPSSALRCPAPDAAR
ncbi:phosphodiester glycosidase family protein [Streptomyces sp. NBC_01341]|uniref:phosphodiester glycosidase family protein n=1 Tax=Streptomyces sp. NBC_01341 TaxID=2903831 RepID=UPI002E0E1FC0|nr:phosphodiester glycosidase family protein [Streptomyces sp. NBC_01341]